MIKEKTSKLQELINQKR